MVINSMSDTKIIIPKKEEVIALLTIAKNEKSIRMQTVGELLGMKLIDSILPKIEGEPGWGYEGLKKFFLDHSIEPSCTFEEALEKLNA